MKKFSRGGGFAKKSFTRSGGGPRKLGGGGFRRPGPREGGDFGGEKKLHPATCSVCGAQCQVPFRPDGSRPIYCRDCFRKQDMGGGGREEFRRDDRGPRRPAPFRRVERGPAGPDQADLVRLLEKMNDKLDRILEALEGEGEDAEE
jgi:CxxC-x17-CxxC domain-containing protein